MSKSATRLALFWAASPSGLCYNVVTIHKVSVPAEALYLERALEASLVHGTWSAHVMNMIVYYEIM